MQKITHKKDKILDMFLRWLNENGALFSDIYIQTYKKGERGAHAKVKIPAHHTVIQIPRRLLIYTNMGKQTEWGKQLEKNSSGISGLNLVYICLYILQDMEHENRFLPYYKILPKELTNFPLFWNEADKRYLENSYLLEEIKIRKHILTKDYQKISAILSEFKFSSICSLHKFLLLRTLIGSRNFGLWIDGKKQATMVPLGDMLNHSKKPDVKWYFEESSNTFVMNSKRDMKVHQEVTDSYGTKCNRSYLLFYGFSLEEDNTCRNTIFIRLTQPHTTFYMQNLRQQLITNIFNRNISSDFNSLEFRQLMNFLRIANSNEQELNAFINNPQLAQNPFNKRNEAAALSYLSLKVKELLNSYPLTLKQNKKNLKNLSIYSNASFATKLVMGEKKIIHEILEFTKIGLKILLLNPRSSPRHLKNNINGYILTLQSMH